MKHQNQITTVGENATVEKNEDIELSTTSTGCCSKIALKN